LQERRSRDRPLQFRRDVRVRPSSIAPAALLQRTHERDQVLLLSGAPLRLEHEVEGLDRVVQREQAVVVQIGLGSWRSPASW
jgi:hypothetical protein